jgi:acyl-CoA synthetase (AMP-forming)/AMP-acid ligase II
LAATIVGAEMIPPATLARFDAAAANAGAPPTTLCPAYGLAEAGLAVTMVPPDEPRRSVEVGEATTGRPLEAVACGQPVPGADIRLGSGEVPSPLQVRPPGSSEWVNTSDVAMIDADELVPMGRTDDLVIVAGRNLHAGPLEAALTPLAWPTARAGSIAIVADGGGLSVLFESREPPADRFASEAASLLRSMTSTSPRRVVHVPKGSLPRTPSGKIRRRERASLVAAGELA